MTETALTDASHAIRAFREALIHAGYQHANAAGELRSQDGTTWISTSYVYGEYSIYAWRRPRGHAELGESDGRRVMRVRATTDPADVDALARRLVRWAKKPPARTQWPVRGLEPLR